MSGLQAIEQIVHTYYNPHFDETIEACVWDIKSKSHMLWSIYLHNYQINLWFG